MIDIKSIDSDIEKFILDGAPKIDSFMKEYEVAMWEMVINGGKRFRPKLIAYIYKSFTDEKIDNIRNILIAMEVFHTYSLIHDDLPAMDDAKTRRNHPTLHTKYSEALAILAGDALNTYAFELISTSELDSRKIVDITKSLSFNGGISGMVLGQAIDCAFEGKQLSKDELDFIHLNKTCKLIASSMEIGAISASLDKELQILLYSIGIKIGLLFQINDDILDYTGEDSSKDSHKDENKNTYINLLGYEESVKEKDRMKEDILKDLSKIGNESCEFAIKSICNKFL